MEQLLVLMHLAACNMAASPALRGKHAPEQLMLSYGSVVTEGDPQPPDAPLTSSARAQLLHALAPLSARVHSLEIDMPGFELGQQELCTMKEVFGDQIRDLHLRGCELKGDFWPAVVKSVPSLSSIQVRHITHGKVVGAVSEGDLMLFCSHVDRPFSLILADEDPDEAGIDVERLERAAALWESPVVIETW
jgi:hypothetical protein